MKTKTLIFGAGDFGHKYINFKNKFEIEDFIGFIDNNAKNIGGR